MYSNEVKLFGIALATPTTEPDALPPNVDATVRETATIFLTIFCCICSATQRQKSVKVVLKALQTYLQLIVQMDANQPLSQGKAYTIPETDRFLQAQP